LAVKHAGAFIQHGSNIKGYLERYRKNSSPDFGGYEAVAKTFEISFERLDEPIANLLQLCVFLNRDYVSAEVLSDGLKLANDSQYTPLLFTKFS